MNYHDSRYWTECPKHGWHLDEEDCDGCWRDGRPMRAVRAAGLTLALIVWCVLPIPSPADVIAIRDAWRAV